MQLSPKQKEFWNNCNCRWNVKTGATRSGKTYLDYYIIPKRIRACKGDGLIVLLGNTQGTIERNAESHKYRSCLSGILLNAMRIKRKYYSIKTKQFLDIYSILPQHNSDVHTRTVIRTIPRISRNFMG